MLPNDEPDQHIEHPSIIAQANDDLLAKLHKGVFIIQTAIICYILLLFISIGVGIALASSASPGTVSQPPPTWLTAITAAGNIAFAITLIFGWWLFSNPIENPEHDNAGATPRMLVRLMVVIGALFTTINVVASFYTSNTNIALISFVIMLIALGFSAVQFFAEMFYIRWMAPLLPNDRVMKRATLLLWLGPVLMTVGLLLLGLGPIIALVLYWNMLDWIRKDLKAIRESKLASE